MKSLLLILVLLIGGRTIAQQRTIPVHLDITGEEYLTLSWASRSNELYEVTFITNLVQNQSETLKSDVFSTSPTNQLRIHRGRVPSAYFQVNVQAVLGDTLLYELIQPNNPTFIGEFCVTNDVQFEAMKEELGLAGPTFDFATNVVIGIMAPEVSSIGGHYRMDYVRETAREILVCYYYEDYYPYCMPAFHKEMFVVKTEHRNKPVRLAFRGSFLTNGKPFIAPLVTIDPEHAYSPVLSWPVELP